MDCFESKTAAAQDGFLNPCRNPEKNILSSIHFSLTDLYERLVIPEKLLL